MSEVTGTDSQQTHSGNQWFSSWGVRFLLVWVLVMIMTIPLPRFLLPSLQALYMPFFRNVYLVVGNLIPGIHKPFQAGLASDSTGMYLHYACMALLSALIALVWNFQKGSENMERHRRWLHALAVYFLALELMSYGFSKLYLKQFYTPQANIAFTRMAELTPDILYWSSMGTSPVFSYVTGALEVLVAILLLFARTRFAGASLALVILLQVVLVNFAFDISVKLFSVFLTILSLIVLSRYAVRFKVLLLGNNQNVTITSSEMGKIIAQKKAYWIVKTLVIILLFSESLYVFVSGKLEFPEFKAISGAWEVQALDKSDSGIATNRVFIHSAGYLILQHSNDSMKDYQIQLYRKNQMVLVSIETGVTDTLEVMHSKEKTENLHLEGTLNRKMMKLTCRRIDLQALPLYRREFHWTSDGGF